VVLGLGEHDYLGYFSYLGCLYHGCDGYMFTVVVRFTLISVASTVEVVTMLVMFILAETACGMQ
jgi:hypothetical protein